MRRYVVMSWEVSSFFGWGIYGLNLALQWARDPDVELLARWPVRPSALAIDPLAQLALRPFMSGSAELVQRLTAQPNDQVTIDRPLLVSLGNDLGTEAGPAGKSLSGKPNFGIVFLDTPRLTPEGIARGRAYETIVAGSSWNEQLLRAQGLERVVTILQGIDPALFHPGPPRGLLSDRFLVFSGGKLERRKGQDIVLAAWRIFAARHPEAILVTAWHSPWPAFARSVDVSALCPTLPFRPDGRIDVPAWARAAGIPDRQLLDLGVVPNAYMPAVLREMDAAVFPNRCEGGTNLVAMECMACGVPTILSANTGHLDLIGDDTVFPLFDQQPGKGEEAGVGDVPGWGESRVEEVVEALERVHADRAEARRRAANGARLLSTLTWARTAATLKEQLLPHLVA